MNINFKAHKLKKKPSDSAKPPNCQAKDSELVGEYCFTMSAQSWSYRDRRKPEVGTIHPTLIEWLEEFFIVYSIGPTIEGTTHSRLLHSLEHVLYMGREIYSFNMLTIAAVLSLL